jgi:hypothetical protein
MALNCNPADLCLLIARSKDVSQYCPVEIFLFANSFLSLLSFGCLGCFCVCIVILGGFLGVFLFFAFSFVLFPHSSNSAFSQPYFFL